MTVIYIASFQTVQNQSITILGTLSALSGSGCLLGSIDLLKFILFSFLASLRISKYLKIELQY